MKTYTYFSLLLLCSIQLINGMQHSKIQEKSNSKNRSHKRNTYKQQIKNIDKQLQEFSVEEQMSNISRYKSLQLQKKALLEKQLNTYLDNTSDAYKQCKKEIDTITKKYDVENLTVSHINTQEIRSIQEKKIQYLKQLQKEESLASKKFELTIIAKLKNSLLAMFDEITESDEIINQDILTYIFNMKTIWFASEEITPFLIKQMQRRVEIIHNQIYKNYCNMLSKTLLIRANHWEQLYYDLENIKSNIEQLPNKKLKNPISKENKLNLIKEASELEKIIYKGKNLGLLGEKLKTKLKQQDSNKPEGLEEIRFLFDKPSSCIIL